MIILFESRTENQSFGEIFKRVTTGLKKKMNQEASRRHEARKSICGRRLRGERPTDGGRRGQSDGGKTPGVRIINQRGLFQVKQEGRA